MLTVVERVMGQVFRFTCDCGYATEVHGGPGGIFAIELATVTCSDCQEVLDISLGPWDEYPVIHGGSSREEKLKTRKEAMLIYQERVKRQSCSVCNGRNFTLWGQKMGSDRRPISKGANYSCPKCDGQMTRSRRGILID